MPSYVMISNEVVYTTAVFSGIPGYIEVPFDGVRVGDALYGDPLVHVPCPDGDAHWAYTWDVVTKTFSVNLTLLSPYILSSIDRFHIDLVNSGLVEYNNGTTTFTAFNTEQTRNALRDIADGVLLVDDQNFIIAWENDDPTPGNPTFFSEMTPADAQNMRKVAFEWQQKYYKAKKVVRENHATTPYSLLQDAKDDYLAALV